METLFYSSIATLIAEVVTLPICTLKTNYQNNSLSIRETFHHVRQNRLFFKASIPSICSQVVSTSTKYTFYQILREIIQTEKSDLTMNSMIGMMSGVAGSLFNHPFDVWKNYQQRGERIPSLHYKTLYQGYTGSIGKNVSLYSVLFPINDYYSSKFKSQWISAPLTTLTVSLIVQPFDYYKVVKMAGNSPKNPVRGLSLMLARNIPHFAITMYVIDIMSKKSK